MRPGQWRLRGRNFLVDLLLLLFDHRPVLVGQLDCGGAVQTPLTSCLAAFRRPARPELDTMRAAHAPRRQPNCPLRSAGRSICALCVPLQIILDRFSQATDELHSDLRPVEIGRAWSEFDPEVRTQ